MKTNNIKTHWAADIFALNESDIDALAEDIKKNGQVVPIKALKDGSIVDGRNRFLACQKAGVEPVIETINADGEELTDEQICAVAISCNSMRRDETTSKRACAAAEMWKRLYPGETRGGDRTEQKCKNALLLEGFAKTKFKVGERYAKQALAILNYSADLFEDAKNDLAGTYKIYQERKAQDKEKRDNLELLNRPENADLKQQVENGTLNSADAVAAVKARHQKEIEEAEYKERARRQVSDKVSALCDLSGDWTDPQKIAASFHDTEHQRITDKPAYECLENLAKTINEVAAILKTNNQ